MLCGGFGCPCRYCSMINTAKANCRLADAPGLRGVSPRRRLARCAARRFAVRNCTWPASDAAVPVARLVKFAACAQRLLLCSGHFSGRARPVEKTLRQRLRAAVELGAKAVHHHHSQCQFLATVGRPRAQPLSTGRWFSIVVTKAAVTPTGAWWLAARCRVASVRLVCAFSWCLNMAHLIALVR